MQKKSIRQRLNDRERDELSYNKSPTDELLECVLGMNDLDIECYKKIRDMEPTWTNELSNELDKDESTVHRSLSRLSDSGLIIEERVPYEGGGYKHEYTIEDTEIVSRRMRNIISEMLSSAFKQIDEFQ